MRLLFVCCLLLLGCILPDGMELGVGRQFGDSLGSTTTVLDTTASAGWADDLSSTSTTTNNFRDPDLWNASVVLIWEFPDYEVAPVLQPMGDHELLHSEAMALLALKKGLEAQPDESEEEPDADLLSGLSTGDITTMIGVFFGAIMIWFRQQIQDTVRKMLPKKEELP